MVCGGVEPVRWYGDGLGYFVLDLLAFSALRRFSRTAARSRMIFDRSAGGILAQASRAPRPAAALPPLLPPFKPPMRPSLAKSARSAFESFTWRSVAVGFLEAVKIYR